MKRVEEFVRYDAGALRAPIAWGGLAVGAALWRIGKTDAALRLLTRVHSSAFSETAARRIATFLGRATAHGLGRSHATLTCALERYVSKQGADPTIPAAVRDPLRLLGKRILVLKSPRPRERGVVLIDYSYVFPLFARYFDVNAIAEKYHLVLEPSWCGFCNLDLLSYTLYDCPIFVECGEPRDEVFLTTLKSNLVPVPVAANWWVDYRIVRPEPGTAKDVDVVMVAAWATYKRHSQFFEALARLRGLGQRFRVLLIGYPANLTQQQIANEARRHGVIDQIEFRERLALTEVVRMISRARVHVLWSRTEGFNRAGIEALFCDVPIIIRDGHNFGFRQPYVNPTTGAYSDERNLGEALAAIAGSDGRFHPRDWVMAHMTPQTATDILECRIRDTALALGEAWTNGLAVKTVALNRQQYWDDDAAGQFEADYAFLESRIQRP